MSFYSFRLLRVVQKLEPVKDPRTMPRVIGGPDWSPAASRVGKAFRVAAPHGATVRAGAALDSREVAVLARDALVEVVDATPDEQLQRAQKFEEQRQRIRDEQRQRIRQKIEQWRLEFDGEANDEDFEYDSSDEVTF